MVQLQQNTRRNSQEVKIKKESYERFDPHKKTLTAWTCANCGQTVAVHNYPSHCPDCEREDFF